jgi:hypothetical protein
MTSTALSGASETTSVSKKDYFSRAIVDEPGRAAGCTSHSGVQRDAPAVAAQGGPFERPGQWHGQCRPIGSAQDAAAGVETPRLSGQREIAKKHGTDARYAYAAGRVAGPAARGRHRQHGPIDEASTLLGDADLLRPVARLLHRSQRWATVTRRCRGNIVVGGLLVAEANH